LGLIRCSVSMKRIVLGGKPVPLFADAALWVRTMRWGKPHHRADAAPTQSARGVGDLFSFDEA
jgi:hypothetical protein